MPMGYKDIVAESAKGFYHYFPVAIDTKGHLTKGSQERTVFLVVCEGVPPVQSVEVRVLFVVVERSGN